MANCDHCGKKLPLLGAKRWNGKSYHDNCLAKAKQQEHQQHILREISGLTQDDFYHYVLKRKDSEEQDEILSIAAENQVFEPDWIKYIRNACKTQKHERGLKCCQEAWDAQDRKDYRLSRQKFKEAAELGNPDGMYNYARLSFKFNDYKEGARWLRKAIESGTYDDAQTRQLLEFVEQGGTLNIED